MAIKPILFNTAMVQAILAGRKTETRRIVKPQPAKDLEFEGITIHSTDRKEIGKFSWGVKVAECVFKNSVHVKPLYFDDILWVREPARVMHAVDYEVGGMLLGIQYAADGGTWCDEVPSRLDKIWQAKYDGVCPVPAWVSKCQGIPNGVFKEAARLFLKVKYVGVERLQDITEDGVKAEGLSVLTKDGGRTYKYGVADPDGWPGDGNPGWPWTYWEENPQRAFAKLWNSTTGKPEYRWGANPWVWVVRFTRCERPKDWPNG